MKKIIIQNSPSKFSLEFSLSWEEVNKEKERVLKEYAQNLEIEGFRRGSAPLFFVESYLGEDFVKKETVLSIIRKCLQEAIEEFDLKIVGEPKAEILSSSEDKEFKFKVEIEVLPELDLPNYRKIAKEIKVEDIAVEEKEVEDTLKWLQEQRKDEKGNIPKLDDSFARSVGNFSDLSHLKESIKEGILKEKELERNFKIQQEILKKIVSSIDVELPQSLIQSESERLFFQTKKTAESLNLDFKDYLTKIKKTEESLKEELKSEAKERILRYLVIQEIAKVEQIKVGEEELEEGIQKILNKFPDVETAQKTISPQELRNLVEDSILQEKVLQFLLDLALKQQ